MEVLNSVPMYIKFLITNMSCMCFQVINGKMEEMDIVDADGKTRYF